MSESMPKCIQSILYILFMGYVMERSFIEVYCAYQYSIFITLIIHQK